ncbi:putative methanogenesis marker protein 8 [Methanocalculus alkaliphilus]|uniref:methanogenesis marker 8 protein n=1 Tax=Methanocalculus alkaliphilus TaxID=768730 RepID=UPI00209C719E|nr:methanogenesis marker 8 protein [Methanocalculus alkaliphilus]MCP1716241.1 putative methanogenesis marker protein 8 [Methanocalculus alkaliphilus]
MTEYQDEHIIEAIGRARIVVRDGEVIEVGEPMIRDCPLAKRFAYPIPEMSREHIAENIRHRIRAFGMCTPDRQVEDDREFVGFGASEIISFGMKAGILDAAVLACDGAGTVIVTKPSMVQGIGGRMSGLVRTVPYPSVIERIEEGGGIVLDHNGATMDQVEGAARAVAEGFAHIAVTVALPDDAETIRGLFPDILIIGVHVTGLSEAEAEMLASASDIVTACASGSIRRIAGERALLQAGVSVPVFAMTKRGKELLIEKIRQSDEQVLIKPTKLPATGGTLPEPLV